MAKKRADSSNLVTLAELARRLDISRSRVTAYKRQGRLVMDGKLVDLPATIAKLKATTDPSQDSSFTRLSTGTDSVAACHPEACSYDYQKERARKEYCLACLAELELAERTGELVPLADVLADATLCSSTLRENMLALPVRLAPTVAAMTDEDQLEQFLKEEIEKALRVVSRYLEREEDEQ